MIVSECCGAQTVGNSEDYGLCTECKEHTEFVDDETEPMITPPLPMLKLKRLKQEDK